MKDNIITLFQTSDDIEPDDQLELSSLNIAEGDVSNEPQGQISDTNFVEEGSSIMIRDFTIEDEESSERKPKKEKPKRNILLAPSFFAAKKE